MQPRSLVLVVGLLLATLAVGCASRTGLGVSHDSSHATSPPAALLLVTQTADAQGLEARPIDPMTLADIAGREPLSLGQYYTEAFSPDGRTLAAMVMPDNMAQRNVLHLIDLQAWRDHVVDVPIDGQISGLVFSLDGNDLYWTQPTERDASHGLPHGYVVRRYHIPTKQATIIATLPSTFVPYEIQCVHTGQVALYGIPTDTNNLAEDAPHVMIVDVATQRIAADMRLDGVRDGQRRVEPVRDDQYPYELNRAGVAWDLEHNLLYVVHPTEERVTVVDLERQRIARQVDIQPQQSWLDRALALLTPTALAKRVPGTGRSAVLNRAGTRLYTASIRREMIKQPGNQQQWLPLDIPLGLQVIDTSDLHELHRFTSSLQLQTLSPDGQHLLFADAMGEAKPAERHTLYIFDTAQNTQQAQVRLDYFQAIEGFAPDSDHVYINRRQAEAAEGVTLQVLDLVTQRSVAERTLKWGYLLGTMH